MDPAGGRQPCEPVRRDRFGCEQTRRRPVARHRVFGPGEDHDGSGDRAGCALNPPWGPGAVVIASLLLLLYLAGGPQAAAALWGLALLLAILNAGLFIESASRRLPLLAMTANRLGAINHLLLTLEHASCRGLRVLGYVLNQVASEHSLAAETNPAALRSLTSVPCLGEIPYIADLENKRLLLGDLFEGRLDLQPLDAIMSRG